MPINGWSLRGVILRLLLYYLQYMDLLQPICIRVILSEILSLCGPEYFVNQLLEASLAMKYVREFVYNVMIFGQPYTIQYNDIVAQASRFLVWTHQTLAHCYYSRPHEMLINNSNLLISHIAL